MAVRIEDIFKNNTPQSLKGRQISGITLDSRAVIKDSVFVAMDGARFPAETFVPQAINNQALCIVSERPLQAPLPVIVASNVRESLGGWAHQIYGYPSRDMKVVGVTGTNGKSTTALLIAELLSKMGQRSGYLGTLGFGSVGRLLEQDRTSPEAPEIHEKLAKLKQQGCTAVSLECSSHGLVLGRLNAIDLDIGVFTNLTQDHLDFHKTMEAYAQAKRLLFDKILAQSQKAQKTAVINADDPIGLQWLKALDGRILSYSLDPQTPSDIVPTHFNLSLEGTRGTIRILGRESRFYSPLAGAYNLSNVMAAIGACLGLGFSEDKILQALETFSGVRGRLQRVENKRGIHVFVDYAHTPDALEKVLTTLRPLCSGRILVVFGCGGDRDKTKRPLMAASVSRYADVPILTSDNPRTESPVAILEDMRSGLDPSWREVGAFEAGSSHTKGYYMVEDRTQAIALAISRADQGDVVLIAGKGHEAYQEIHGVKTPFDDVTMAKQILGDLT